MSTKMKGLLKGLRYISQIFDEDKEPEMQIGFPTDVKHVAHIGWDGPSVDSPSWMKEFKAPGQFQSAPLGPGGEPQEGPEIKWVSEDSKSSSRHGSSSGKDPDAPRSSRRQSSENSDSPKRDSSTKKGSRRHSKESKDSKESSDSVRSVNRQSQDGSEYNSGSVPDIPKKSRRKKSKEAVNGGSTKASKSKGTTCTSQFPDSGPDSGFIESSGKDESLVSSKKLPYIGEEEKGCM